MAEKPTYEELAQRVKDLEKETLRSRRAEEEMRASEEKFFKAFHNGPLLMTISSIKDGRYLDVNDRFISITGYSRKETIGTTSVELGLISQDDRESLKNELLKNGRIRDMELTLHKKDGEIFYCLYCGEIITVGGKQRLLSIAQDITDPKMTAEELQRAHDRLEMRVKERTKKLIRINEQLNQEINERKQAEEALRDSEERFRSIFEVAGAGMATLLPEGNFLKVNPALCKFLGYTEAELLNLKVEDVTHPEDRERTRRSYDEIMAGQHQSFKYEKRYLRKDGSIVWGYASVACILSATSRPMYCVGLVQDITARMQAEEALKKSSEKIKLFAYSVAHDLKNPSIVIYGLTKRLKKLYGDNLTEKGENFCDQIVKSSEQIATLAETINTYIATKEKPLCIESVNVKEILRMIREEFSAQLSIRQIQWSEPEDIPEIKADKLSFVRVYRNFVDNALKYGGDELSEIEIGFKESDKFYIFSVRDDGVGLKKEESKGIFALFKRKETSKGIEGTGLGLAIVKEIAERHLGEVWTEAGSKKGIAFCISISKQL